MVVQNGCDFLPPGSWDICCDVHDIDYAAGGGLVEKLIADIKVGLCVAQDNPLMALLIVAGLTVGGWFFFPWAILKGKNMYEILTGEKSDGKF
jgi:hypothetical protein